MKKVGFLFLLPIILVSCVSEDKNVNDISFKDNSLPEFINRINVKDINLPAHFLLSKSINDTIDYSVDMFEESDSSVVKIYVKNSKLDTIFYPNSINLTVYKEGDLDGDGLEEIGLMPVYKNGSCRMYYIYGIENKKWKEKYKVLTHLPDRASGTDYFKFDGINLRIIQAKRDSCCQCLGLDTSFFILKYTLID